VLERLPYTGSGPAISAGVGSAWKPRVNVTGDSTQGSTSTTFESASGIKIGDLIVISQINPSYAWGGDAFNVFFRENPIVFSSSTPHATGNIVGIYLKPYSYQDDIVGCVFGDPGVSIANGYTALADNGKGDFIKANYDLIWLQCDRRSDFPSGEPVLYH
jgi:hypothetical protein